MSREHEVRLPDRFWRHGMKLSTEAKAMYSILLTFTNYTTSETRVGNARLEKESGYGQKKVKKLLVELERTGFIQRVRLFAGNLKSARILLCLKFVSMGQEMPSRTDGAVLDRSKMDPISLPSHSHPSPIQKPSESSEPFPEPETPDQKPERIM